MDDLLAGCLAGDATAWRRFVRRYAGVLYAAVRRVVEGRSPRDPAVNLEDLVQDVFVRLLANDARLLRAYRPERASLVTWLTIVAHSTACDALRRKRPSAASLEGELEAAAESDTRAGLVVSDIPADLLTPRQRLVLHLLFDRDLDVAEAARVLRVEPQTVRSAKHKALERLRRFFGRK